MWTTAIWAVLIALAYRIFAVGILIRLTYRVLRVRKSSFYDLKITLKKGHITYQETNTYRNRFYIIRRMYSETIKTKLTRGMRDASIDWELTTHQ